MCRRASHLRCSSTLRGSDDRLVVPRRSWTTYDEMATRLGTVRDVLSRARRGLENEGLLQVKRNEIVILDEQGLARRGNT